MKVLVIGVGGVGSSTTYLLGGMNVNFDICDNDTIEESNLNRQFFYNINDIGKKKVIVAKEKLLLYFPHLMNEINTYEEIDKIDFKKYDLIVDCTDNIKTRKKISEICKLNKKKMLYVSAQNTIARVGLFTNKYLHECLIERGEKEINCFHCPSAAFTAGSIAANEIVKFINGKPSLENKIVVMDLNENKIRIIEI